MLWAIWVTQLGMYKDVKQFTKTFTTARIHTVRCSCSRCHFLVTLASTGITWRCLKHSADHVEGSQSRYTFARDDSWFSKYWKEMSLSAALTIKCKNNSCRICVSCITEWSVFKLSASYLAYWTVNCISATCRYKKHLFMQLTGWANLSVCQAD